MAASSIELRQIRLLIADTDPNNALLTDGQLDDFFTLEGHVKLAAAAALEVISTSEVLVSKVIRTQDLATDGTKVAAELRARAAGLRAQVEASGDLVGDDELAVVEFGGSCGGPELADWWS